VSAAAQELLAGFPPRPVQVLGLLAVLLATSSCVVHADHTPNLDGLFSASGRTFLCSSDASVNARLVAARTFQKILHIHSYVNSPLCTVAPSGCSSAAVRAGAEGRRHPRRADSHRRRLRVSSPAPGGSSSHPTPCSSAWSCGGASHCSRGAQTGRVTAGSPGHATETARGGGGTSQGRPHLESSVGSTGVTVIVAHGRGAKRSRPQHCQQPLGAPGRSRLTY